jgi:hypothetical protein
VQGDSPGKGSGRSVRGPAARDTASKGDGKNPETKDKGNEKDGKNPETKGEGTGKEDAGGKDGAKGEEKAEKRAGQAANGKQADKKGSQKAGEGRERGRAAEPEVRGRLGEALGTLAPLAKWLVFAVLALVVLFILLRAGLGFLAGISGWARGLLEALNGLLARLFGQRGAEKADFTVEEVAAPLVPFAAFRDPFADGRADTLSPRELVAYSFAALQAWAAERGFARAADETELEYTERVGAELPALEREVRSVGAVYARSAYAPGGLPAGAVEAMRQFWRGLEAPLSPGGAATSAERPR